MSTLTAQQFYDLLEEYGLEPRRYSGRGMYGAECPGFVTNGDPTAEATNLMYNIACDAHPDEVLNELFPVYHAFQGAKTDDMGRSTIVYFPTLRFPKE